MIKQKAVQTRSTPYNVMARKKQAKYNPNEKGFTLIELSIVLVIIGLIVGGVLVGQDLIRAAEIRSTVAQIEKYNSAVNTFRTKYSGIPGDLSSANATAFGFTTRNGGTGRGDNNSLIDSTVTGVVFGQEAAMFWNDLSTANLIDGNYASAQNADSAAPLAVTAAQIPTTFPTAKIGRGNVITAGSTGGLNYYLLAGLTSATVATGAYNTNVNLTPIEAFNMDNKLDDGLPNTGIVQAKGTSGASTTIFTDPSSWAAGTTVGNCLMGGAASTDTTDTYNRVLTTGGETPACIMRFRFN